MRAFFNFQPATRLGRRKTTFRHKHAPLLAFLILALGIGSARAGEIPVGEEQGHPPQEDIIYIPQIEWPAVLKQATEGIFIPYKEYQDLYRRARAAYDKKIMEQDVPGDIQGPVIIEAAYTATVREDVLNFTAEYRIIQHIDEPRILTLPLDGVRFQEARLNDAQAHVFGQSKHLQLVIPGAGSHRLRVRFLVPLSYQDKTGTAGFQIPSTLLNEVRVTSAPFYEISFPNAIFSTTKKGPESTESIGFLGPAARLDLRIQNRRSSSVKTAQIHSLERHNVYLSADLVEHSAEFMLDIRNDKIGGVRLSIPRDVQVHSVTGQGIAGWTRVAEAEQDTLQLDFHVPVTGITQFTVELYRYRDDPQENFILGDVRLLNAANRQGELAIYYDPNIRLDVQETTHLEPMPAGHAATPHKPNFFIYRRYHVYNLPYAITLARAPVPKQVELAQYNLLKLEKEQITFRSSLNFSGLKEGTSQFDFTHPADYRVKDVQVYVNNQLVAENHKYLTSEGILRVDIVHPVRASDMVGFLVNAERLIDQDQFKSAPQKISVPVLTFAGTQRTEGTLRIEIADDFLLEDIALEGYRPADEMLIAVPQREGLKAMTYRYRVLDPRGQLTLSKRRAEQTSDTVSFITVDEDLLRANAYVRYQLSAGTQEQFYFAIPAWEGSKVNIEGSQIKEKKKVSLESIRDRIKLPKGVDLAGHDIWNVVLQKEASANYELTVDYQKKIDRFNEFQPVPLIMPLDVSNDTGYLVLEASKNTEISSEKKGLSEVETYEIPAWPAYKPSNRIIESLRYFTQPYTFRMAVKRMEELPVLAALIKSETLAYTFDKESQIFFEGTYIIRNTNQQFLEIILPEHFMFWGATVEGMGIKPRKGSERQLYIPLPVDNSGDIRLQLTGQLPKSGGFGIFDRMKVQSPRLGMPVLESTVLVYYPQDYSLLNVKGNFEKLPKIKPQEPVLRYVLGTAFATVWNNARRLLRLPGIYSVQGRLKSAADDIGDQFTAGNTSVVSLTRSQVQQVMPGQRALQARVRDAAEYLEEKADVSQRQYEPYYLSTDYDVAKDKEAAQKPTSPMPSYARKKGLLSLSINIPREGIYLSAKKLWGNSRLSLTFLAGGRERVLSFIVGLLIIALGFYVQSKKFMTPSMYCMAVLAGGTFIPLIAFRSYVFLFNGAVGGAFLFALVLALIGYLKKASRKYGLEVWLAALLIGALCSGPGWAQDLSPESFPDVSVYVPYQEDRPTPLTGSESIYLSTGDYFNLKTLAEPPYEKKDPLGVLAGFHRSAITIAGQLKEDQVLMTAQIDVFVNDKKNWVMVDLPFRNVFVEALTLDGEAVPVRVSNRGPARDSILGQKISNTMLMPQDVYQVPVYGQGYHKIQVVFHAEVQSQLGKKSLAFLFPGTEFTDFSLDFGRKDIFVELTDPADAYYLDESGKTTVLKASPTNRGTIHLSWFPKKYLKKSEKPLIYADCRVDMEMEYDEVKLQQDINIRVEKSSIASLEFSIPAGSAVTDVFSNKVKSWRTREEVSGQNVLEVVFKQEITDQATLTITARKPIQPGTPIPTVFMKPLGTERVRGFLNLYAAENTRLRLADIVNLTPAEIQSGQTPAQPGAIIKKSYSFLAADFSAMITTFPEERKVTAQVTARHVLEDDLLSSFYRVQLDIKKNSLSSVRILIPEGHRVADLQAPQSSGYTLAGNVLTVPLIGAVKGAYYFDLTLTREFAVAESITVESIELKDIEKQTGSVAVYFPRGFEVNEQSFEGLRSASVRPAVDPQINQQQFDASYGYDIREARYRMVYDIARKDPVIDAVKVYHATVRDSLVDVKLLNIFTIKNAPVDFIDMIIPVEINDAIDIEGEGINTVLKKEINQGRQVAIRINFLTKVDRSYLLQVSYKKYFDQQQDFAMPQIIFPQARNTTEFISVEAQTAYQVESAESVGLIDVEPDSIPALPQGIDLNDILWSYRASGVAEWNYRLDLRRLAREKLVKANIVREDIKALVIPSGYVLNEVAMKVNNRTLQFLPVKLPRKAELWSLKVAGESVKASRQPSDKTHDTYLIPLIKSGAGDRSFDIRLVYLIPTKKLGWSGRIDLGMLQTENIPVEKTTLTVFVPENYKLGKFKTNTEEVDVSMIEAEKTLELGKEFKYWTSLASSAKGELKQKALKNREKVMDDYAQQYEVYYVAQNDLQQRVGNKKFNQKIVQSAQMKNTQLLSEADQIIQTNQAVPRAVTKSQGKATGKSYSQRRNVKGWNFKTGGYQAQDEVEQSISNYLTVEDQKQTVQQQQLQNVRQEVQMGAGQVQQGDAVQMNDELAYGMGGFQTSSYDPNLQVADMSRVTQDQRGERRRAAGGFQQSSYDTSLGLLNGFGGPPPQQAFRGDRTLAAQGRASNLPVSAAAPATRPTEEPLREVVQEFWGGEVSTGTDNGRAQMTRSLEGVARTQEFWGDGPADGEPKRQAPQKMDSLRKAEMPATKQSTLLKGYRSIDIPLLEQGSRFSFKKLGGNPTLKFSYRKRGLFARAGYLLLLIVCGLTVFGLRKVSLPVVSIGSRLRGICWLDLFYRLADSRVLMIIYALVFVPALFSGLPLAGVMLGLLSISMLRKITVWRYRKKDISPPYTRKTFFHYCLSFTILLSLILSLIVYQLIIVMVFATILNWIYVMIFGIVTLLTRKVQPLTYLVPDEEAGETPAPDEESDPGA